MSFEDFKYQGNMFPTNTSNARREAFAASNLGRLLLEYDVPGDIDPLEVLLRAKALREYVLSANGGLDGTPEGLGMAADAGVIETLLAGACERRGAWRLAEQLLSDSISAAEHLPDFSLYRLALRLTKLLDVARRRGSNDRAAAVQRRLEEVAQRDLSPRTQYVFNRSIGVDGFNAETWTSETLVHLRGACDTYEALRQNAVDVGDLGEYVGHLAPPYDEAVEVSLSLGLTEEAFNLLERGKARSLLDALRQRPSDRSGDPDLEAERSLWNDLQQARAEFDDAPPGETRSSGHFGCTPRPRESPH